MVWRFKRISNKGDAVGLIGTYSMIFYFLAATQVLAGFIVLLTSPGMRTLARLPVEAAFNYFVTAAISIILTAIVHGLRSRIAAVLLLLVSITVAATSVAYKASNQTSGNFYLALVAIWAAARMVEATFKLHGRLAVVGDFATNKPETPNNPPPRQAAQSSPPQYDKEKWAALLKYDDEIAIVAGRISILGQRWVDELARAYLTLNDKSYLSKIEEKIWADARADYASSKL